MNIGVILATEKEYSSFKKEFNIKEENKINDFPFEIVNFNYLNHSVYVLNSDIGLINASSSAQYLIDKYNIDLILNIGACGGLTSDTPKNTILLVKNALYYDFDLSLIDGVKPAQYPGFKDEFIPLSRKYIDLLSEKLNLNTINCASGDKFIADKTLINHLVNDFKCEICDMEVVAETLIAIKNKIDIISIKIVSDNVDANEYEENALSSNEKLMKEARKIFELIR